MTEERVITHPQHHVRDRDLAPEADKVLRLTLWQGVVHPIEGLAISVAV